MKRKNITLTLNLGPGAIQAIQKEAESRNVYAAGVLRAFVADLLEKEGQNSLLVPVSSSPISGDNKKERSCNTIGTSFPSADVVKSLNTLHQRKAQRVEMDGFKGYYSFQRYMREMLWEWLTEHGHDIPFESMFDGKREIEPIGIES